MASAIEEVVERFRPYVLLIYVDVIEFQGEHIRSFYEGMADRFRQTYSARFEERRAAGELGDVDPMVGVMVATRWFFYFYTVEKCFGVLSVIIFAQLGVYAYFAAAFVPVLFGTFLDDTPVAAAASGSAVALLVHYGLYYTGHHWFPYYMDVTTKNPGIATALGVVAATVVGAAVHLAAKARRRARAVTMA